MGPVGSGSVPGGAATTTLRLGVERDGIECPRFQHLFELLALGTPFFGLMPEIEPAFLTSAFLALNAAGFGLRSLALRTEHDPVQVVWERGEHLEREAVRPEARGLRTAIEDYLGERGEPARYLHVHGGAACLSGRTRLEGAG